MKRIGNAERVEMTGMNAINPLNGIKITTDSGKCVSNTSKNEWKLTDSLKEKIVALAKEDAQKNIYMGTAFINLRKAEVSKVAPNRAALIGQLSSQMISDNMDQMKEIQEADRRWLCMLFGIPYEVEYQGEGTGSAIHVYNEEGEEFLTYTQGVGWQEKETKAETEVHSALKWEYYAAFKEAREAINSAVSDTDIEFVDEDMALTESKFDVRA